MLRWREETRSRKSPIEPGSRLRWSSEVHVGAWLVRHKVLCWIGFGILCRFAQYWDGRPYWVDEQSLAANVRGLTPLGFFGPLLNSQLAPPGFLILQWLASRFLGDSTFAHRLVPLLAGVASLFLVWGVARVSLKPGAVWLAVALFAVSDDLIYFASEAKQYSTDVAASLACLLMGLTLGWKPLTLGKAACLGLFGAGVVWFSHPSIFVLASVGMVGLARSILARGDGRSVVLWVAVGLAWVGSFALVHRVAMDQLGHQGDMWAFWAFAFPPMPPRSVWDATWFLRRFALLFVDPLNFDRPFGPSLSWIPALGLFLVGCRRVDRGRLTLILLPIGLVFLASTVRLYPFHGRLVLFLTPALLLGIAAGLEAVASRRILYFALLTIILGLPTWTSVYHLEMPRNRSFPNPFGDNRPQVIDPYRFPF